MEHALKGSLHTAFGFVRDNWANLLQVTLVPFLITAFFLGGYLYFFQSFFTQIFEMASTMKDNDAAVIQKFITQILKLELAALAGSLVLMFVMALAGVRVVRLYALGEKPWWLMNKDIAMATLMWALYSIGIYFISMIGIFLIMIGVAIVGALVGGLLALIIGDGSNTLIAVVSGVIGLAAIIGMIVLMIAIPLRLAAGMPVVALGKTPDFMRDMWQLSKGYTMALVGRGFALYLLTYAIALIVMLLLTGTTIYDFFTKIPAINDNTPPEEIFALVKPFIQNMMLSGFAVSILLIPFFWVVIVWLTEVNKRLLVARGEG